MHEARVGSSQRGSTRYAHLAVAGPAVDSGGRWRRQGLRADVVMRDGTPCVDAAVRARRTASCALHLRARCGPRRKQEMPGNTERRATRELNRGRGVARGSRGPRESPRAPSARWHRRVRRHRRWRAREDPGWGLDGGSSHRSLLRVEASDSGVEPRAGRGSGLEGTAGEPPRSVSAVASTCPSTSPLESPGGSRLGGYRRARLLACAASISCRGPGSPALTPS